MQKPSAALLKWRAHKLSVIPVCFLHPVRHTTTTLGNGSIQLFAEITKKCWSIHTVDPAFTRFAQALQAVNSTAQSCRVRMAQQNGKGTNFTKLVKYFCPGAFRQTGKYLIPCSWLIALCETGRVSGSSRPLVDHSDVVWLAVQML